MLSVNHIFNLACPGGFLVLPFTALRLRTFNKGITDLTRAVKSRPNGVARFGDKPFGVAFAMSKNPGVSV